MGDVETLELSHRLCCADIRQVALAQRVVTRRDADLFYHYNDWLAIERMKRDDANPRPNHAMERTADRCALHF